MNNHRVQTYFFLGLLTIALVLSFLIVRSFLNAIVIGGVFAVIFRPFYLTLQKLVKKESIASLLTIILVLVVVFFPLFFLGKKVFEESRDLYVQLSGEGAISNLSLSFTSWIQNYFPSFSLDPSSLDLGKYLGSIVDKLFGSLGTVFSSVAQAVINIALSLMIFYYLLKEGSKFENILTKLSPLSDNDDKKIFDRIKLSINSVIRGSLVIGLIQGIIAGVGFKIFGIPNPALWGGITVIAAFIPGVGTSLIMIPSVLYLLLSGHTTGALGLLIWGFVAVGLIDNFLGPRLMTRGTNVHQLLILLSVLGGIGFFGPVGFLLGPLILSFLFALLDIYPEIILKRQ